MNWLKVPEDISVLQDVLIVMLNFRNHHHILQKGLHFIYYNFHCITLTINAWKLYREHAIIVIAINETFEGQWFICIYVTIYSLRNKGNVLFNDTFNLF